MKRSAAEARKIHTVLSEFKRGKLATAAGKKVTDRRQAVAIAMSEAAKRKR